MLTSRIERLKKKVKTLSIRVQIAITEYNLEHCSTIDDLFADLPNSLKKL